MRNKITAWEAKIDAATKEMEAEFVAWRSCSLPWMSPVQIRMMMIFELLICLPLFCLVRLAGGGKTPSCGSKPDVVLASYIKVIFARE